MPAALVVVAGMVSIGGAPAQAADDPVGGLTNTVKQQVDKVDKTVRSALPKQSAGTAKSGAAKKKTTPSRDPGTPSSRSGDNDVDDPKSPDHGGADVLKSGVAGTDVAGAGHTNSTVEDDDSTHSDANPVTVGGMAIPMTGAHADSDGEQNASSPTADGTDPVCSGSSGQLCLDVLYADSTATDDGSASDSRSETELAGICAGGDQTETDSSDDCDAPVSAGAGGSYSAAHRNQRTGRTTATSDSYLLQACLSAPSGLPSLPSAPLPGAPSLPSLPTIPIPGLPGLQLPSDTGCALGLDGVGSEGHADSGARGDDPSASRRSVLLVTDVNGQKQTVEDPESVEIPPTCPAGASVLCGYLNQGETYTGADGLAGTAQEALSVSLLPGLMDVDVLDLVGARSETLVHNDGGEATPVTAPDEDTPSTTSNPGVARPAPTVTPEAAAPTGGLPNTGGPSMALLAVGLLAAGGGAILVAASRVRRFGFTTATA